MYTFCFSKEMISVMNHDNDLNDDVYFIFLDVFGSFDFYNDINEKQEATDCGGIVDVQNRTCQ